MSSKCNVAYVIQAQDPTGYVKVGLSSDPQRRFTQIRHSVPFEIKLVALLSDGRTSEAEMKELLRPWQTRGEWFRPRPEINTFLAEKRRKNMLLECVEIDEAYAESFLKPAVLEFLDGRPLLKNSMGDLVYRFLREGFSVLSGRHEKLIEATKGNVTAEMVNGLVPLRNDEPLPQVSIPTPVETESAA